MELRVLCSPGFGEKREVEMPGERGNLQVVTQRWRKKKKRATVVEWTKEILSSLYIM